MHLNLPNFRKEGLTMSFTDLWEAQVLNYLFRGTALTNLPANAANFYIGLHVGGSAPTDAGGFVEPSGGAYARVAVVRNTTDWSAAATDGGANFQVTNANTVTFPQATADWGTVTHWGIFDTNVAAQPVVFAALTQSKAVNNGDTANFGSGQLIVKLG
jgi:hypothetical protein